METHYIDTPEKLHALCQRLAGSQWLALDTEFMRETTYYPKLCLLQIGTMELTACIDPLALPNLDPLLDILYDTSITKVMHACSQDMEIFFHLRSTLPSPVFDTQIAAPLIGFPEQAGYARLVEDILQVRLEKIHTRADWSHRPLSEAQIKYAEDDVIYLCQVYTHLRDELARRNRLAWLSDDFANLSNPANYDNPPKLAWRRVKASYKLSGNALAALQILAEWREQTAKDENRPRGHICKDDVLIDIARQQPKTQTTLGRIRGLHDRVVKRHGDRLLALLQQAGKTTPEPLPEFTRKQKLTPKQEALICLLNAAVHMRALEQQLSPTQLAPPKDLKRLVQGHDDLSVLQGWRKKLIGDELQAILQGNRTIQVVEGQVSLLPSEKTQ